MANGPLTVRAQLDAVVSSVPVKPVMSMLAIVVAAARVVVPVGVALKITSFVATGVQLHVAPPDVFDQYALVAHVQAASNLELFPDATPQFSRGNIRTADMTQSVALPSVQ